MTKSAGVRLLLSGALLCAASAFPAGAQTTTFDTSGNGMLKGSYYFRHVLYAVSTTPAANGITGDLSEEIALYGNIVFDGNGNYSINNGTVVDSAAGGQPQTLSCYLSQNGGLCSGTSPVPGTYSISASGFGFLSNPIVSGDSIYGAVAASGMFTGSSTESSYTYNDLFIGAPVPSPLPTNASFSGAWTAMGYFPDGDLSFPLNPNGAGALGTVTIKAYTETGGATPATQTATATYSFSNGAAIVTYPNNGVFLSGKEFYYFSPDGNFFFGGASNGYDMIVGVKNPTGAQTFTGLYYQAGVDQDTSSVSSGKTTFDSYYGALNVTNSGAIYVHERLSIPIQPATFGQTFADSFTPPATGAYTDTATSTQYIVADGGALRIGQGIGPFLGLTVAMAAPAMTPSGAVYLNPTGIVNAASFSPFTAGISPGEFITLFGTNLAASAMVAPGVPYPTTLGNVQVIINGAPAPIYFVSPTQISVIVPAADSFPLAQIQVLNGGVASNAVTMLVNQTTPGLYTIPSGGLGYAAAVHVNGQIVSPQNPAAPGESIELYMTGLGAVSPTVPDGAAPPTSPLSTVPANTIFADVGGTSATVLFAGLAPTLAGLYQVNVTIPTTVTAGNYTMDISGPDSYTAQAVIAVGTGTASASARASAVSGRARGERVQPSGTARLKPCFGGRACGR